MIELKHIKKEFENACPLKDVNCVINDGDVISVIGPSGTGKSTLLRCINMLDKPSAGEIFVDGECITAPGYDTTKARKKIGMVFQSFNLFDHLTIIENIMNPQIDLLNRSKQEAYDKAIALLKNVGLASKVYNYPSDLSGGQKQRVAICRTLAMDPEIILLDEPTSALDPTMINEVQAVIKNLALKGTTMMIVTHEMHFAKQICNRVFYMDEGGIYEDGTPDQIFNNPTKEKTRIFVKQLKVLNIKIDNKNFDFQGEVYKIDDFGHKNEIDPKKINRIHSAFEEMCKEILINNVRNPHINVTIEYSEKTSETNLTIEYKGKEFNPQNLENYLPLTLFNNSVVNYTYTYDEHNEYSNIITATIK